MYLFIVLIVIVIIMIYRIDYGLEGFVDPYSLELHNMITAKEAWWDLTHSLKMYEMRPYTPIIYRE